MPKESVRLNKLVYAAMTILDDGKTLIYDFTTTRSKSSTVLNVNSYTQKDFCWRFKRTLSTMIWKTKSICTIPAIIPKINRFTAARTMTSVNVELIYSLGGYMSQPNQRVSKRTWQIPGAPNRKF